MALPGSKHGQDSDAKKAMESQLKYNLEDKSAKRYAGIGFEANNYLKRDNLINNLRFFINIVVSNAFPSKYGEGQVQKPSFFVNKYLMISIH